MTPILGIALCLTGWLLFPTPSAAQGSTVTHIAVGADLPVDVVGVEGLLTEPYLAADPSNPLHLVGAAIVVKSTDLEVRSCAVITSFDGGSSWISNELPVTACADPYVAILDGGDALVTVIGDVSDHRALLAFRSADGGRTWSERPAVMDGNHDHGTLAIDGTRGEYDGSVYAVSQGSAVDATGKRRQATLVSRSSDGGRTFAAPTPVILSNLWMTAMNPVVLSDGTLVVSFATFGRLMADGDFSWLRNELDWMVTSRDGGKTFSTPLFVSDTCGRTFPVMAADASQGPYRDRLYWVCNDRDFGHIYLHYSTNRGEGWSDPVPVNQGSGRAPYVRTPAVAINKNGVVAVSWYDGRASSGDAAYRCQEIYFSASLDGGSTFSPPVKVSSEVSCPATAANGQAGRRWPAGGDYHGLTATSDGRFHLLWADSRSGRYELRAATVDVSSGNRP